MRLNLIAFLFFAVSASSLNAQHSGAPIRFYALATPAEIRPAESVRIEYVLENTEGKFTAPDWNAAGFDLLGELGQSSSISIVNGQRSAEYRFRYLVQPRDTGEVLLPVASVTTGEATLHSEPLTIRVSALAPPGRLQTQRPRKQDVEEKPLKSLRPTVRI
ncbi:MAG: BatD family protein [Lewinellaceae bacterium]|nr:BatD family protein [Lewinellaceae bacterium]